MLAGSAETVGHKVAKKSFWHPSGASKATGRSTSWRRRTLPAGYPPGTCEGGAANRAQSFADLFAVLRLKKRNETKVGDLVREMSGDENISRTKQTQDIIAGHRSPACINHEGVLKIV